MPVTKSTQNVLITGGRGFIGVNLIHALLDVGARIRVLDNLSLLRDDPTRNGLLCYDGDTDRWALGANLIQADIRDEEAVFRAAQGADAIVHLAANSGVQQSVDDPMADMDCNIKGTLSCLNAAERANVSRLVFASSGAPLGMASPPVDESTLPMPISPYGVSKLTGEAYCSAYTHTFGVQSVALRFSNVYGPYSSHKTSIIGQFLRLAMEGKPWEIYGDGSQTRDFIFVGDLVNAIVISLSTPQIGGEVFHIASGIETPIIDVAKLLAELLEAAGCTRPKIINGPPRVGDMPRSFANISKAAEVLKWTPKMPLKNGLKNTIDWFLAEYA